MKVDGNLKPGQIYMRIGNDFQASVCATSMHILGFPMAKSSSDRVLFHSDMYLQYSVDSISEFNRYVVIHCDLKCDNTFKNEIIGNGYLVAHYYILELDGGIYCNTSFD